MLATSSETGYKEFHRLRVCIRKGGSRGDTSVLNMLTLRCLWNIQVGSSSGLFKVASHAESLQKCHYILVDKLWLALSSTYVWNKRGGRMQQVTIHRKGWCVDCGMAGGGQGRDRWEQHFNENVPHVNITADVKESPALLHSLQAREVSEKSWRKKQPRPNVRFISTRDVKKRHSPNIKYSIKSRTSRGTLSCYLSRLFIVSEHRHTHAHAHAHLMHMHTLRYWLWVDLPSSGVLAPFLSSKRLCSY